MTCGEVYFLRGDRVELKIRDGPERKIGNVPAGACSFCDPGNQDIERQK
jgi:hypothetical protein